MNEGQLNTASEAVTSVTPQPYNNTNRNNDDDSGDDDEEYQGFRALLSTPLTWVFLSAIWIGAVVDVWMFVNYCNRNRNSLKINV